MLFILALGLTALASMIALIKDRRIGHRHRSTLVVLQAPEWERCR
jgi:hypothetical protein